MCFYSDAHAVVQMIKGVFDPSQQGLKWNVKEAIKCIRKRGNSFPFADNMYAMNVSVPLFNNYHSIFLISTVLLEQSDSNIYYIFSYSKANKKQIH